METVSLLTITQGSRCDFLEIQKLNVLKQTYSNIIEWVLVDSSKSEYESKQLAKLINTWTDMPFRIVISPWIKGRKIGELRNIGNSMVSGQIIACLDDDDYYFPEYVELGVKGIQESGRLIAGCGPMFIYDLFWRTVYQAADFHEFHSVNNCYIYRRELLTQCSYDNTAAFGEEASFTKNFSVPMHQMDPFRTVIQMAHRDNTVDKHKFLRSPHFSQNIGFLVTDHEIRDLIKDHEILDRYESFVGQRKDSIYDIVYYAGLYSITWDPRDRSLGGAEQAIVELSREWAKLGKRVAVYGQLTTDYMRIDGVDYYNFHHFHPYQNFNVLILWRLYGMCPILTLKPGILNAKKVFVDLHETMPDCYNLVDKYHHLVTGVMCKSNYHLEEYNKVTNKAPGYNIMNGIKMDVFNVNKDNVTRNPYRFCYTSDYTRGLTKILENIWKYIVELEPRAELHLYYGLDKMRTSQEQINEFYNALVNSKNVCDHGRQPIELIAREKYMSNFHLYPTDCVEVDCIAVRESLVAGCMPIIPNQNVFKERDGIHIEGDYTNPSVGKSIAEILLSLVRDNKQLETLRENNRKSKTVKGWDEIALEWNKLF